MFEGIKNGWDLIKASIKVFNRHPVFLVPLICVWLIYAPIVIYLKWYFPWGAFSFSGILLIIFLIIFFFALLITFSCSMLLELIQQIETGKQLSLAKAFGESTGTNLIKIIPLAFIWSVIWFILTLAEAILRRKEKSEKEELSARNVAKTLGGYEKFSWWGLSFDLLNKGIRMAVFLIMPAFAWQDLGFINSIKKGFAVLRAHLMEFATGFTLTYLASVIVFLPPGLLLYITGKLDIALPDWIWVVTIIYISFAWSYSLYLEQMFTAELYLWHLKWEKEYEKAEKTGKKLPTLRDVPKPSILDEVSDLLEK